MCPRAYDSSRRHAASQETRVRMVEAARALIGGKGDLSGFSMEAVADRAGVARMTVYNQFGSKVGLLEALADHLARAGGMSRMPHAFREPDPERALRLLVEIFVGFWASDRVTMRRLRALAVAFPAETAGPRQRDAWRREAVASLLRRGGSEVPEETVDVLATLTSFETFDSLCVGRRRAEEVARLLGDLAVRIVRQRPPPATRSGRSPRARARTDASGSGTPGSPSESRTS